MMRWNALQGLVDMSAKGLVRDRIDDACEPLAVVEYSQAFSSCLTLADSLGFVVAAPRSKAVDRAEEWADFVSQRFAIVVVQLKA